VSERVRSFSSGAILMALLIFAITGIGGWASVQIIDIPSLRKDITILTTTMSELSKSIENATIFKAEAMERMRHLEKEIDECKKEIK